MTSPLDLPAIRARCEAATGGPWHNVGGIVSQPLHNEGYPSGNVRWVQSLTFEHRERTWPDADFIAHARTDIPEMADVIEALCEALEPFAVLPSSDDPYISLRAMRAMREDARDALARVVQK